jgi:hypothetical protein
MVERTGDDIERALRSLAREVEFPRTPSLTASVTARLQMERRARERPPFPGVAVWSRRRTLVLAAAAILLLLVLAAAARLAIGAIEIRVVPSPPTPHANAQVTGLGPSLGLADAQARVGFPIGVPSALGPPDEVHMVRSLYDRRAVVLAWAPRDGVPRIGGTPWGAVLIELPGRQELAFKELMVDEHRTVSVAGVEGLWLSTPHSLVLLTPHGERRFSVSGNVLVWQRGAVTYRLETALDERETLSIARTLG